MACFDFGVVIDIYSGQTRSRLSSSRTLTLGQANKTLDTLLAVVLVAWLGRSSTATRARSQCLSGLGHRASVLMAIVQQSWPDDDDMFRVWRGYGHRQWADAITAVFLSNSHVGPGVIMTLDTLLAVVLVSRWGYLRQLLELDRLGHFILLLTCFWMRWSGTHTLATVDLCLHWMRILERLDYSIKHVAEPINSIWVRSTIILHLQPQPDLGQAMDNASAGTQAPFPSLAFGGWRLAAGDQHRGSSRSGI